MPIGVFRSVEMPSLDERIHEQIKWAREKQGEGNLADLLSSGDTWVVK